MTKASTTPSKSSTTVPRAVRQRALVIGISGYRVPVQKLPAVAADVKEIAKLLSSKNGVFQSTGVKVITERQATRDTILAALKEVFVGARATDTIFVYLAGHGSVEGDEYSFVPYDAKIDKLAETGVPLTAIKKMFDATASRRVFLWLDFCHSGGILARGKNTDDVAAINRAIGVVSGHGKVIVAACTPTQFAYEDPKIGHGLFTDALLRGLKGAAKSAQREVTALSLYEFIDHEVKHTKQQPTFYGKLEGRIVLMHYPNEKTVAPPPTKVKKAVEPKPVSKAPAVGAISTSGDLLLLDGRIYASQKVTERPDGSVELLIVPKDAEEEAALRSLRGDRYSNHRSVNFAFRNQSFTGRVGDVSSSTSGTKPVWSMKLTPEDKRSNFMSGVSYIGFTAQDMSEMRARFLLLDPDASDGPRRRDTSLASFVLSPLKDLGVKEAVFKSLGKETRVRSGEFLRRARLWAVYYLHAAEICDDILELKLGPVRAGKLAVKFRGTRNSRYAGEKPQGIIVEGVCSLD